MITELLRLVAQASSLCNKAHRLKGGATKIIKARGANLRFALTNP